MPGEKEAREVTEIELRTESLRQEDNSRRKRDAEAAGRWRRPLTAPRRWVRSSLPQARDDAAAASHCRPSPLLGASVSVGETGVRNRRVWRMVLAARNVVTRTHLLIIVLVETLVVIIFILKVLVLESFAGEEIDRRGITYQI